MNIANINRLADYLDALNEAAPGRFNMNQWYAEHPCGTVGCIAGHAMVLLDPKGAIWGWKPSHAAAHLGLDIASSPKHDDIAEELFAPDEVDLKEACGHDYRSIRANHAAKVLRHLAATGKVDWSVLRTGS